MLAESSLKDTRSQVGFKVEMLLKEAELSQHDISFLTLKSSPGGIEGIVSRWIANTDNIHVGAFNAYLKNGRDQAIFATHPKTRVKTIADSIRIKKIDEILLIGKEVAIVCIDDEINIFREKRFVDALNRVLKSILRISFISQQRENV